jgi:hypothetical protein
VPFDTDRTPVKGVPQSGRRGSARVASAYAQSNSTVWSVRRAAVCILGSQISRLFADESKRVQSVHFSFSAATPDADGRTIYQIAKELVPLERDWDWPLQWRS